MFQFKLIWTFWRLYEKVCLCTIERKIKSVNNLEFSLKIWQYRFCFAGSWTCAGLCLKPTTTTLPCIKSRERVPPWGKNRNYINTTNFCSPFSKHNTYTKNGASKQNISSLAQLFCYMWVCKPSCTLGWLGDLSRGSKPVTSVLEPL